LVELDLIAEEVNMVLETGTFGARAERHLSRVRLRDIDQPAIEGRSVQILFEVPAKEP
jgi:hypothetical protein